MLHSKRETRQQVSIQALRCDIQVRDNLINEMRREIEKIRFKQERLPTLENDDKSNKPRSG